MARLARLVVPGLPHHITQRGNRRQQTFFCDEDYVAYVELMADWRGLLNSAIPEEELRDLREHSRTGHPLGNTTFVNRLEQAVGRVPGIHGISRPEDTPENSRPPRRLDA